MTAEPDFERLLRAEYADLAAHESLLQVTDVVSLARRRRQRWQGGAAAALVAVVVVGVLVGLSLARPESRDSPPAGGQPDDSDRAFRLGPDQVPSLFGQTGVSAEHLLRSRGLRVATTSVPSGCGIPVGTPEGTVPATGALVRPGDTVTLRLAGGPGPLRCPVTSSPMAYQLLEYAEGSAPAPPTSPGLDLTQIAGALRGWAGYVQRYDNGRLTYATPHLVVGAASSGRRLAPGCRATSLFANGAQPIAPAWTAISVVEPSVFTGIFIRPRQPCQTVYVEQETDGRIIDAVVARGAEAGHQRTSGVADVVGDSFTFASTRLEGEGYRVVSDPVAGCGPAGVVTSQSPAADGGTDADAGAGVRLTWTHDHVDGATCPGRTAPHAPQG